ncbi:MAG TPA: phosphoribosyltransferase family protein [Candidatus Saccharimonadales bacterium]|nr:phosphoribosyltransferase family protein [Candidatus Saccharimonadales bacterium]
MGLIDEVVGLLVPHECLGCGRQPNLICYDCLKLLPAAQPLHLPGTTLAVYSRTTYDGLAKDLVWRLKFGAAQTAAKAIASELLNLLPAGDWLLVPVPTTTGRRRQRGYDQAELISRQLARLGHMISVNVLARQGNQHQVGANREQRLAQLTDVFRVTRPKLISGQRVLLIDDVVTTGATLKAAALALKAAGAAEIAALTFARA